LTTLGNSSALAMAAIRGLNPCWLHYADLGIMPTWPVKPLVAAVLAA
jgi:hypothetical protein